MTSLPDLARHWFRQTDKGKGLRLDQAELDLLNAMGVGRLIADSLAEFQRQQCQRRVAQNHSISGGRSGSIDEMTEPTSLSHGTTQPPDANEALARVQRMLS
jgi:hypothetical protein